MNEIVGKNVLLEVYSQAAGAYVPYICCKDMSVSINPELINVTTVSSGRWNDYRPRRIDWVVTVSGVTTILGDGRTIFTTLAPSNLFTRYAIRMTFTDDNGNDAEFSGNILLKNASIDGNQDQFSQWENGMQGTGPYQLLVNGVSAAGIVKLPTPVLGATAISATQINLLWNSIANATGYRLYFNTDNDFATATLLASLSAAQTSYSHTGLTPTTIYYYFLVAVGDGVAYSDSDPAESNATTLTGTATFLLEWGWFNSDPYPYIGAGAVFMVTDSKTLNHNDPLEVDTQTGPQGKFLAIRVPKTESAKATWFNTAFNNGTIPDTVFHSRLNDVDNTWVIDSEYTYYITRVPYYHDAAQPTILS